MPYLIRHPGYTAPSFLDSPSTAGCENWPLQPAAQGGEPVEPRLLSALGGLAGMTIELDSLLWGK